jgi:hypothetical protein
VAAIALHGAEAVDATSVVFKGRPAMGGPFLFHFYSINLERKLHLYPEEVFV